MVRPLLKDHRIGLASSTAVVNYIASFGNKSIGNWLPVGHPARTGQITRPGDSKNIQDLHTAREYLTDDQLVSLVAACGPCHCLDGWSYLSNSVSALVARNGHSAKHFAYYAQLRAAMSILAIFGVGIFNYLNICIDASGKVHKLEDKDEKKKGLSTHTIVWRALELLAQIDANAEALLTSVALHRTSLFDAITSIWPSRQPASILPQMTKVWAFDLAGAGSHRDQRNISSYCPHDLNELPCSFRDEMNFVAEIWNLFEPSVPIGFSNVDVHLLRRIFVMLHDQSGVNSHDPNTISLADGPVSKRYDQLEPSLRAAAPLEFFLDEVRSDEPALFKLAADKGTTPRSMISRAILLLRAASALNSKALDDAGFSPERSEVRPWLDPLIVYRGIVTNRNLPDRMADLWDETKFAVEDFQSALSGNNYDVNGFFCARYNGTPSVTQFERAIMWGLCP